MALVFVRLSSRRGRPIAMTRLRHSRILVIDVIIAVVGVAVFIGGDLVASRVLRLTGFIVVVLGIVAAAIWAALRSDDPEP